MTVTEWQDSGVASNTVTVSSSLFLVPTSLTNVTVADRYPTPGEVVPIASMCAIGNYPS